MRVIVAGGRDFVGDKAHEKWLREKLKEIGATTIVCGMTRGADIFGLIVGRKMGLGEDKHPADWDLLGKSAGHIRNEQMAKVADACILFPGGRGTKNMEENAKKYNLKIIKFE